MYPQVVVEGSGWYFGKLHQFCAAESGGKGHGGIGWTGGEGVVTWRI